MTTETNAPEQQKTCRVIFDMSEETRAKEMARMREKALHDEASALKHASDEGYKRGFEEGWIKGFAEQIPEVISSMRANGVSEEQIKNFLKTLLDNRGKK